jgi:hypothetical protein
VAENIYLGVAGGYLHSDIDEHSTSNGTESSARFALYGGALIGPSLLTATAAGMQGGGRKKIAGVPRIIPGDWGKAEPGWLAQPL